MGELKRYLEMGNEVKDIEIPFNLIENIGITGLNKTYIFENDFVYWIPEIYLLSIITLLLVLGVTFDKQVITIGQRLSVRILNLGYISVFILFLLYLNEYGLNVSLFNNLVVKNELNSFLLLLVTGGTLAVMLMSAEYLKRDSIDHFEYILLLLLALFGVNVIITANDLVVVYLGIELLGLALYVLAAFKQNSNFSTEAGLKYFVLGALASCIFLFGVSLFYGFTGITNFTDINYLLSTGDLANDYTKGIVISMVCMLVGLLMKVGAVPFHMWLPDVYEGSSTIVTAFFAAVPKIAIFGLIIKLFYVGFFSTLSEWSVIFIIVALLSIFLGSVGALYQSTLKRLFAYSAIGHTGFILLGFLAASIEGMHAILMYLFIYLIMTLNLFAIMLSLRKQTDFRLFKLMDNLNKIYSGNKLLAVSFCLLLFSIAGIPPMAGFFSKLYIFFATVKEGFYITSIIGILLSVAGTIYYIRLIKIMFFSNDRKPTFLFPVETEVAYVISYTTIFGLVFCLYSYPIIMAIHELVLTMYI